MNDVDRIVREKHLVAAEGMVALLKAIGDALTLEQNVALDVCVNLGASIALSLNTHGRAPSCDLEVVMPDGKRTLIHRLPGLVDLRTLQ